MLVIALLNYTSLALAGALSHHLINRLNKTFISCVSAVTSTACPPATAGHSSYTREHPNPTSRANTHSVRPAAGSITQCQWAMCRRNRRRQRVLHIVLANAPALVVYPNIVVRHGHVAPANACPIIFDSQLALVCVCVSVW